MLIFKEASLYRFHSSQICYILCLFSASFCIVSNAASSPFQSQTWGPFFEKKIDENTSITLLPPLFSSIQNPKLEHRKWDIFYPLIGYVRYGKEWRFHMLQLFNFSGGSGSEDAKRISLFPFYFHKKSSDENQNYIALVPFWGRLKNRFLRDEIHFIMFPIYIQSKKRDVITNNYLAPFFHLRKGDRLKGWQLLPLVGFEKKGLTTKTNEIGETTQIGGHKKFFFIWPLYFHDQTGLGTNPQSHRALLPLFSFFQSPHRSSLTAPWPIGLTITRDHQRQYREIGFPSPFIVFARGEGKRTNRLWPLFGKAEKKGIASEFYLWPLFRKRRLETDYQIIEQRQWGLVFYVDKKELDKGDASVSQRRSLWPFFNWRSNSKGQSEFQLIAPFAPLFPANEAIARHYSPAFCLFHSVHFPEKNFRSRSFLWNFYRREKWEKELRGSALFGLIRWKKSGAKKSIRVLGIKL